MNDCSTLPIIAHYQPSCSAVQIDAARLLARKLAEAHPDFCLPADFVSLAAKSQLKGPTLHLDDLSAIQHLAAGFNSAFYQERARLRAGKGDLIVSAYPVAAGYELYCRETLRLGEVEWFCPLTVRNPLRLAEACWEDELLRAELLCRVRRGQLQYLHPHMGTLPVWQLASLLRQQTGRPLQVISSPPMLTTWVNDKIQFNKLVTELLGAEYAPRTFSAASLAMLAHRLKELAANTQQIGIKLPCSAGGDGTVVLDSQFVISHNLQSLYRHLEAVLVQLAWDGHSELLVDSWDSPSLGSPSVQLWIPPLQLGQPLVEGIFDQIIEGGIGIFVGAYPLSLPSMLTERLVNLSWLLGYVLQQLGYVGRCSFDTILIGETYDNCRVEFVECNGRWGGTSSPMTLMNRLFGDFQQQPHLTRNIATEGLRRFSFLEVLESLRDVLYDKRTGRGRVVLMSPGRLAARSELEVIVLGSSSADARHFLEQTLLPMLKGYVGRHPAP